MGKFMYVFSEEEKEKLLNLGYKLIAKNKTQHNVVYVFENNYKINYNKEEVKVIHTDRLNF